jgi:hypothetical protein
MRGNDNTCDIVGGRTCTLVNDRLRGKTEIFGVVHRFLIRCVYTKRYAEKRNPYTEIVRKYRSIEKRTSSFDIRYHTTAVNGLISSSVFVHGLIVPPHAVLQNFVAQIVARD